MFLAAVFWLTALPGAPEYSAAARGGLSDTSQPLDSDVAKNLITAKHIDFETVVPANSPMASAIVVKGKVRLYLFPPGSEATRTETSLVVRAYGSVFVYEFGTVRARRLDAKVSLDLSTLPEERDGGLLRTIAVGHQGHARPAGDLCPDCIIPVVPPT